CYASGRNPLSEEERQRRHEEAKARAKEKWRLRYHSDPEFREKCKQSNKNSYANPEVHERRMRELRERYANDSEFREKKLRYYKEKYANDPQHREGISRSSAKQWLELRSTFEQDPKAHQLRKDQIAKRMLAMYHEKAEYRWRLNLAARLRLSPRYRDEVVWNSHKPVIYSTKVNHTCATCDRERFGGLKLWWQRKNEPDKYDCFRCFAADREVSTPIYFPPNLQPLLDRGPVERPRDHDEKGDEGSGTGSTT
ncbi:unnamed protein product, partial [Aureobasidium mustum]